jgi:hypothetical protein
MDQTTSLQALRVLLNYYQSSHNKRKGSQEKIMPLVSNPNEILTVPVGNVDLNVDTVDDISKVTQTLLFGCT